MTEFFEHFKSALPGADLASRLSEMERWREQYADPNLANIISELRGAIATLQFQQDDLQNADAQIRAAQAQLASAQQAIAGAQDAAAGALAGAQDAIAAAKTAYNTAVDSWNLTIDRFKTAFSNIRDKSYALYSAFSNTAQHMADAAYVITNAVNCITRGQGPYADGTTSRPSILRYVNPGSQWVGTSRFTVGNILGFPIMLYPIEAAQDLGFGLYLIHSYFSTFRVDFDNLRNAAGGLNSAFSSLFNSVKDLTPIAKL